MPNRTKTTTANRSTPEQTNDPVYGSTIASKAVQQRTNDEKVQRPKATRNTKLYPTTITAQENMDTECYADMHSTAWMSDRKPDASFETTLDGNANRTSCGGIPVWNSMANNYDAPDVATTKFVDVEGNVGVGTGYRKSPKKIEYSVSDNQNMSQSHVPGFEGELTPIGFGYKAGSNMTATVNA